jgi:arginase
VIEAPSILGLKPTGVEALPEALLAQGLIERLGARHAGRVDPFPYDPNRDPESGILNGPAIAAYSSMLADSISAVLESGEFPVVLGGDCSILLGALLALRRRGRYGLLFLDGHADFYQPAANVNGEAASSELAFATGRGPDLLTMLEGRRPLVRDEDVVALGMRDAEEAANYGSQPLPVRLRAFDVPEIRRRGIEVVAGEAVSRLTRPELAGFWVHLDADVLDDAIMPAVDYRMPGGLSWEELGVVLDHAVRSGKATGLHLTIFNPRLDHDGCIASALVSMLGRALLPQGA